MKDLVTKGTGNSRMLKSAIPAGTTWEEALALLRAGNFPIDLKGLNSAGVSTTGSAYSKANVLPDSLCTSLGITSSTAEPKDAWNALLQRINTVNTSLTNFISTDFIQPTKQGVARPNLLENWYFYGGGSQNGNGRFPINQKGSTSQTSAGYFIDRWRKNANGTTSLAVAGMTVVGTGSAANGMVQPIEYSNRLFGKQITISILNSAGALSSATATLPTSLPSSDTQYAITSSIGNVACNLRGNSSYFYFQIFSSAVSSTAVVAVKLELGPNQTLARQVGSTWVLNEIPHYATELMKCQRHMIVFKKKDTTSDASSPRDGIGIATFLRYRILYGVIPLPVEMRAVPTWTGRLGAHYVTSAAVNTWETLYPADINARYIHPNGFSFYSDEAYSTALIDYFNNATLILAPVSGQDLILDANL